MAETIPLQFMWPKTFTHSNTRTRKKGDELGKVANFSFSHFDPNLTQIRKILSLE